MADEIGYWMKKILDKNLILDDGRRRCWIKADTGYWMLDKTDTGCWIKKMLDKS